MAIYDMNPGETILAVQTNANGSSTITYLSAPVNKPIGAQKQANGKFLVTSQKPDGSLITAEVDTVPSLDASRTVQTKTYTPA